MHPLRLKEERHLLEADYNGSRLSPSRGFQILDAYAQRGGIPIGLCGVSNVVRRMYAPVSSSMPSQREAWLAEVKTLVEEVA